MTLKNNEHHLGQVLKPSSHTRTVSRSTWKTTTSLAASDVPVVRTRLRLPTDTRLMSFLSCSYMLSLSCFHPVVSCCLRDRQLLVAALLLLLLLTQGDLLCGQVFISIENTHACHTPIPLLITAVY